MEVLKTSITLSMQLALYEASSNVKVEVQDGTFAVCPKCGSKYDILNGLGNPIEGPATKVLQQYYVNQKDKNLLIRNY